MRRIVIWVFLGLGIGKTAGISFFTFAGYFGLKLIGRGRLPENDGVIMQWRDVIVAGIFGGMGFTVALFVADAAGGHDSLRLGALASFAYLGLAIIVGKAVCQKAEPRIAA